MTGRVMGTSLRMQTTGSEMAGGEGPFQRRVYVLRGGKLLELGKSYFESLSCTGASW